MKSRLPSSCNQRWRPQKVRHTTFRDLDEGPEGEGAFDLFNWNTETHKSKPTQIVYYDSKSHHGSNHIVESINRVIYKVVSGEQVRSRFIL